jgi:serpin B
MCALPALAADDIAPAATAINTLGVDLLARTAPADNALLSPYSIQSALAMTYAGAAGVTREEMATALHYPADDAQLHTAFAALRKSLAVVVTNSVARVARGQRGGDPISINIANRLFGQVGYQFRPEFQALVKEKYVAPFEALDFKRDASAATRHINQWVAEQTRDRIRDLIPAGTLHELTRLVLVNAIHLKAPWASEFSASNTKPEPFHVRGFTPVDVPTMLTRASFGYEKRDGYAVVSLPYSGGDLAFVILLADSYDGLPRLEKKFSAALIADCAKIPAADVALHMPRFKLEPPSLPLGRELKSLGMKSAFDEPRGSADFDGIAPRDPKDYLSVSEVIHKAFLSLDEKGTEAAAATAVMMAPTSAATAPRPKPVEVYVNRPFLFAIQHRPSGACLFVGRVVDPR